MATQTDTRTQIEHYLLHLRTALGRMSDAEKAEILSDIRNHIEERVAASPIEIEFLDLPGEQIPLDDEAADTVLITYTLCSIPDVAKAMEPGYSTGNGMGLGLSGSKRLMDEMQIHSVVGQGTTVTVRKWLRK